MKKICLVYGGNSAENEISVLTGLKIAKELEIKWETSSLPNNGLVVKDNIDSALIERVSNLLFNLHTTQEGEEILKAMELSKFEKADYNTYESVRIFLDKFEKEIRPIRLNNDK